MDMNVLTATHQGQARFSEAAGRDWRKAGDKGAAKAEAPAASRANGISQKNEEKLSARAQEFLKNLRKQYGDYDFLIGNGTDDLKGLAKSGSKEFSVILSSAEIERMASDEKYAAEKMQGVEGAVRMSIRICEEEGYARLGAKGAGQNGIINRLSIAINDDGSMKFFAELQKTSDQQRERIEKAWEKRAEEKGHVKRTTVEASSVEELMDKIKKIDWNGVKAEQAAGSRVDYAV